MEGASFRRVVRVLVEARAVVRVLPRRGETRPAQRSVRIMGWIAARRGTSRRCTSETEQRFEKQDGWAT